MARLTRLLISLALVAALAGCVTGGMESRHLQPIPPALVASMSERGMSPAAPIMVRIYKQESELEIWKRTTSGRYALLKTYPMCRWSGKLGPKTREGDRQAPEGFYTVTTRQMNPKSRYYLAFDLGYPNPLEAALGWDGSALMVHGACSSAGCFAMTDAGVAEIYAVVREAFRGGQRSFQVQALPFRMTPANLARYRGDPNYAFWRNLKRGVDAFDVTGRPPAVGYCGGRYVFDATPIDPEAVVDPLAPCPPMQVDPAVEILVQADQRADDEATMALLEAGVVPPPAGYVDGGMHMVFRRMLASSGPERLQRSTSGKVPVSRPDAALADPYLID